MSAKPLSQKLGVPRCAALFSNNFPNLLALGHSGQSPSMINRKPLILALGRPIFELVQSLKLRRTDRIQKQFFTLTFPKIQTRMFSDVSISNT